MHYMPNKYKKKFKNYSNMQAHEFLKQIVYIVFIENAQKNGGFIRIHVQYVDPDLIKINA